MEERVSKKRRELAEKEERAAKRKREQEQEESKKKSRGPDKVSDCMTCISRHLCCSVFRYIISFFMYFSGN